MSLESLLQQRSAGACELCEASGSLHLYEIPPQSDRTIDDCLLVCEKCLSQLEKRSPLEDAHCGCLLGSMWKETRGIQVVSWRMLQRLRSHSWAADALEMLYLDDETLAWAKATGDHEDDGALEFHRDSNGAQLQNGDNVVLIKTLDVKGSSLSAKVGTAVKGIRLVSDNLEQIEGKVDGQQIVILTKYVRKSS